VHGRSFPNRAVSENIVQSYPPAQPGAFNIGMLHTSLTGRAEHETYAPCSADDLRRLGYDYWALGHVHAREVIGTEPAIVFAGNLQGRHARETGPKGATLVTVEGGRLKELEAVVLDAARWTAAEIDLSGAEQRREVEQRVKRAIGREVEAADGRPLALRIQLVGETAAHGELAAARSSLLQDLQAVAFGVSDEVLIEKVAVQTRPLASAAARAGPLPADELAAAIDAAVADQVLLGPLLRELETIVEKLPTEVTTGGDWSAPAQCAEDLLAAARALILGRLRDQGEAADSVPESGA
jgi:DNA repair exonuclease SbcCD nuclease subunit